MKSTCKNIIHFKIKILICFVLLLEVKAIAQQDIYTLEAVALEKISLFITWPKTNNKQPNEFIIGIIEHSPFEEVLGNVYRERKIKDQKVRIVLINDIQELSGCNLLFIPKISDSHLKKLLDNLKNKSVLIISDSQGYAEAGCFINFYEYENKIRFEINQKALEDAGFTVDYRLLKVSKIINPVIK